MGTMPIGRRATLLVIAALMLGCPKDEPPPPLTASAAMLLALQQRLVDNDEPGWQALGLAEAPDLASLCPDAAQRPEPRALRGAMHEAFVECRKAVPWEEVERGFVDRPLHHGINRDDRRCGDVEGCPGLERLCKSELFGYVPGGPDKVKINLHGLYRRTSNGTLVVGQAPRCMTRDEAP